MLIGQHGRGEAAQHGQYELLGELATGGMATVYLGRERLRGGAARLVAVKSMKPELAADEGFLAMFLDEATLTAKIKHPNVVPTLDVVSADGRLLIVMEYVEGLPLAKLLELTWRRQSYVPPAVSIGVMSDVLRGLHAAHELVDERGRPLNVVHRDVSPQNVLIGTDGVARILDFGIAKAATQQHVTAHGEIKGKLAYMPTEQQLGEVVDRRSDVYAAGVVLWEMLASRRLFFSSNEDELVRQVFEARIEPPSLLADEPIPTDVDRAILKALARKREERWWSADEMARALIRAMPPAAPRDIARLVCEIGRDELEQRARHVRELEARYSRRLDPEEKIVLEVLSTGERRRPREISTLASAQKHPTSPPHEHRMQTARITPATPMPPPNPNLNLQSPFVARGGGSVPPGAPVIQGPVLGGPLGGGWNAPSDFPGRDSREIRREQRRAARRRKTILLLGGTGLVILILCAVALLVGMGLSIRR